MPLAPYGDWSTLGVQSLFAPQEFEWGSSPGGINVTTPAGSFAGGEFGKYSGLTQNGFSWSGPESTITQSNGDSIDNPDFDRTAFDAAYQNYLANPTYTAQRLREDKTDDNQYQTAQYRLETLPDGTQRLVQQGDWSDRHIDGGFNRQLLSDLTPLIAAATFGTLGSGLFGSAAPAASGLNGLEAGLASFGAPTTLTGSAAPLALSGTVAPATIGSLSSMLPALAGGTSTLGAGLLNPMTAPTALTGAAEPLALSGQAPLATGLPSVSGLPSLAGGSSLFSQATQALRDNPMLGRLLGTVGGGLLGGAFTPPSGPRGAAAPAVGRPVNHHAPTMTPWAQSQAMPSGLGSTSAGLFDEYMRQQLGGGTRTFNAPTFGGG